jgi:hypothetical protein
LKELRSTGKKRRSAHELKIAHNTQQNQGVEPILVFFKDANRPQKSISKQHDDLRIMLRIQKHAMV